MKLSHFANILKIEEQAEKQFLIKGAMK